jgi:hypothetical protein
MCFESTQAFASFVVFVAKRNLEPVRARNTASPRAWPLS